ncbi:MAG TPA: hypothetical protein VF328_17620, partial [Mycobacterium sp.]
ALICLLRANPINTDRRHQHARITTGRCDRPGRARGHRTYAQLEQPVTFSLGDIVPGLAPDNA